MATVYEARRLLPGKRSMPVACKVLRSHGPGDPRDRERFYDEAMLNLELSHQHPGLVTVHECFEDEAGCPYLIMELVEGCTLAELMSVHERLPFEVVRRVVDDVLDALAFVHSRQVVHRDISPGNVLVSIGGEVKLADLGLARLFPGGRGKTNRFAGTPAYASPEALRCQTFDARSDLFSVGAMMYEMMTGRPPLGHESDPACPALLADWSIEPLSDSMPYDLRSVAMGWLCRHPDERTPATAREALDLLRSLALPMASRDELGRMVQPIHAARGQGKAKDRVVRQAPGSIQAVDSEGKPWTIPVAPDHTVGDAHSRDQAGRDRADEPQDHAQEPSGHKARPSSGRRTRRASMAMAALFMGIGLLLGHGVHHHLADEPAPAAHAIVTQPGPISMDPQPPAPAQAQPAPEHHKATGTPTSRPPPELATSRRSGARATREPAHARERVRQKRLIGSNPSEPFRDVQDSLPIELEQHQRSRDPDMAPGQVIE